MTRGWRAPEPEPVRWSAGEWALDIRGDELADIRFDGSLVVRSVRAVVRDRDWGTVPVSVVSSTIHDTGLLLRLGFVGLGADIEATLTVDASADLTVSFRATSRADFERNRLGLVVLHPPEAAGADLTVTSPAGDETTTTFPDEISPHQPARDIAALRWSTDGVAIATRFAGDIFEMEDQRNWTDASYKTYSTPLSLPFPVRVAAGETIEQSVTISGVRTAEATMDASTHAVSLVASGGRVPSITLGAATAPGGEQPSPAVSGVLVELDCATPQWRAALSRAASAGLPLDVRIVAAEPRDLGPVLDELVSLPLMRLGVFSNTTHVSKPELWTSLVAGAQARGIQVELVAGTRAHFTELNRNQGLLPHSAAVTFSITPQMHATEVVQIVESIAMQRLVAENAVRIAAGSPVHVGPVTLRPRFNAVATSPPPAPRSEDLAQGYGAELVPGATDPRQQARELTAWTIASAAALALGGVSSICYFEQWGPRGVAGVPVSSAIEWLHDVAGLPLLVPIALPSGVWMLAAEVGDDAILLAANLGERAVVVRVEGHELALAPFEAIRRRIKLGGPQIS